MSMAKEERLIDANILEERVNQEPTDGMYTHEIIAAIKEQPTVDAVKVVRCKDCIWWNTTGGMTGHTWNSLEQFGGCCLRHFLCKANDFCSAGKRKD